MIAGKFDTCVCVYKVVGVPVYHYIGVIDYQLQYKYMHGLNHCY